MLESIKRNYWTGESQPDTTLPMNSVERKKYIIEQLESGRMQTELAKELGVTRQAISALWKKYQARGQEVLEASGPGRLKEPDHLTVDERDEMSAWLQKNLPDALEIDELEWSLYGVKRAVFLKFRKRVRIPLIYDLCVHAFGDAEIPEEHVEQEVKEKLPYVPSATDSAGMPSLEEMERSNRETIAKMEAGGITYEADLAAGGLRKSKRSKAKQSPVAKKKRRKKR